MKETHIKNEFGSDSFEGSFGGDLSRLKDTDRMECKICWKVYDPKEGCDYWQIEAGTPFSQLP